MKHSIFWQPRKRNGLAMSLDARSPHQPPFFFQTVLKMEEFMQGAITTASPERQNLAECRYRHLKHGHQRPLEEAAR